MKKGLLFFIIFFVLVSTKINYAQDKPVEKGFNAITKEAIQGQLEFLASDWTEGRETTSKGEFMAGDYIASMFKIYGLKPAGDFEMKQSASSQARGQRRMEQVRTYFQKIPFVENLGSESSFELIVKEGAAEKKIIFNQGTDYNISGRGPSQEVTAPLIFVGYGFKNDVVGYDDFKGVDVRGKIIVCISGYPASIMDPNSEAYKKLNLSDRQAMQKLNTDKQALYEKLGVVGVINLQGISSAQQTQGRGMFGNNTAYSNYPFRFNQPYYEGDKPLRSNMISLSLPEDSLRSTIINFSLTPKVVSELLKGTGISIDELKEAVAKNAKLSPKELKGKSIHFKNSVKTRTTLGRNVLGMIEGENPNDIIVIGAHYDHLGMYNGYIWNGSDDNASGTVGVLTLAKAIMATGVKPKKTIIFATWTGEEKGLFGSAYFVDKFKPRENIALNLNFDMISRKPEKDSTGYKTGMDYSQAYPLLKELVEKANKDYNLGLTVDFRPAKNPQAGTDFASFSAKNIAVYGFDAAMTSDYHQATDHVDKADFDLMSKIIKVAYLSVFEIANMDKKLEAAK